MAFMCNYSDHLPILRLHLKGTEIAQPGNNIFTVSMFIRWGHLVYVYRNVENMSTFQHNKKKQALWFWLAKELIVVLARLPGEI